MDTLNVVVLSRKLRPQRLKNLQRSISWRALPILIVISLLATLIGLGFPTPALAQHEGEQTAEFLPPDTDLYFTINLDPSGDQLTKFRRLLNNWWQDLNVQAKWGELLGELETESGIDIEEDVLPWLGPEIAVGVCNLVPTTWEEPDAEPEVIIFAGTMDKDASDAFFFDELAPYIADEVGMQPGEVPSGTTGDYSGIATLYDFPETDIYWAFSDDYIVLSFNQSLLESSLNLMSTPNPDVSLAGTANFQEAQAAQPERVGMFYCNSEHIWDEIMQAAPEEQQAMLQPFSTYIPSHFAASISFAANGASTTAYCPLPEGVALPTTEPDLLQSTKIIPGDALFFASGQDANAYWELIRSLVADNWGDMVPNEELPSGVVTFDDMITWIDNTYGIDIDTDIFGWMAGEYSLAVLPLTFGGHGPEFPDILILFEVEDTSAVGEHLANIIGGINIIIEETTWGEPDLLETSPTTINGVNATLVTNNAITASGGSPGWLFLDVDTTHYLVIGTTTDALQAAVDASQGEIPSLDEAEEYQGVLSLLPETLMSLGYLNLTQILDAIVSQIPTKEMTEEELADFGLFVSFIPLQCALGFSSTVTETGATMTGALYLLPPPLIEQEIPEGTTDTVEILEQTMDFTQLDPDVGECAVSIDVDITDAPEGASIQVTAMYEPPADVISGFELAATDAGLSIENIAYVVRVDKINITTDNISTATITMKVGKAWADKYGVDNVRIFRIGDDGTKEVLPTEFTGYTDDQAVFVGTSESGLSYFALAGISKEAGTNWALIGGIIGGVIIATIVAVTLLRRRRVA